tara:strand:+ start:46 stop:210 length:165 start_codon:yes stop_codon:yes gene_type:complete
MWVDETWGQELLGPVLGRNTSLSSFFPRFIPKGNETITFKQSSSSNLERLITGD